jgi:alkanesulfonate monooxygenase SsuD/methylene tetrahydromethanopterin reductase-like flavin-dependent oxidoreductase (luciferase family)
MAGHAVEALKPADVEEKLAILDAHCRNVSRSPGSVVRSHMAPVALAETPARVADKLKRLPEQYVPFTIAGTPDEVHTQYQALAMAGIDYFIALIVGNDLETLELLAQRVQPALQHQPAPALH